MINITKTYKFDQEIEGKSIWRMISGIFLRIRETIAAKWGRNHSVNGRLLLPAGHTETIARQRNCPRE